MTKSLWKQFVSHAEKFEATTYYAGVGLANAEKL